MMRNEGAKMSRKWVLVSEIEEGGVWCHGIFDDFTTALGTAIEMIWDTQQSYKGEGDYTSFTEADPLEGDGGYFITVEYKSANMDKPWKEYYYFLTVDQEEKDGK